MTCEVTSIFTFVLQANKRQFGKRTINSLSDYSCAGLFFHWQPYYTASATRSLFAIFSLTVICQEKDWEIWTLHNFMNLFYTQVQDQLLKLSPKSHNPNYRDWRIQGTFQFGRKDKLCLVAQIPCHLVNDFEIFRYILPFATAGAFLGFRKMWLFFLWTFLSQIWKSFI